MANGPTQFALLSRILHWLMAAMLLAMLFIGVTMVASLGNYHWLISIHRPLGITILILAAIRLINRRFTTLPPFPPTMSAQERSIASASERLLYTLMFALPLVGWSMLSAGHYPIVMFGSLHLPAILPANPALYATLRETHTILAYLLFLAFLAHLSAVLFHTLIIRDRLLNRMAVWPIGSAKQEVRAAVIPAGNTQAVQHSASAAIQERTPVDSAVAQGSKSVEAQNKDLVQAAFDQWKNGTGSVFDMLAPDAKWTIVGNSPISRTFQSRQEFFDQVFNPFSARLSSRLIPTVRGLYADGDMVVALFDGLATARDGKPYKNTYSWYLQIKDGQIVNAVAFFDTIELTDLWTRVSPAEGK